MGLRETYEPGTFCWTDLSTSDVAGAKAFYGDLLGWEFEDGGMPDGAYTMCRVGDQAVAAMVQQDQHPGHWNHYISVESADETAAKAKSLGATVLEEPFDAMDAGRMAVFADPDGAVFCVWEARQHVGAGRVNDAGCMTWNELQSGQPEEVADFYAGLFGWGIEPVTEGEKTVYITIRNPAGRMNGGIMPAGDDGAPPFWLVYFTVPSCDAAVARTKELGGGVLAGPMEPGFGRISVLTDPQGAAFAVFEGETDE